MVLPEALQKAQMKGQNGPQMVHALRLLNKNPVREGVLSPIPVVLKTSEVKASAGSNPALSVSVRA